MDKILISFVIPVYNVKDYINDCIDSIIRQKFDSYEVIIVDDGSTDGSSQICDMYDKYNFVKVFHKKNGGLSDARNFGIDKCSGKYILFVDSDDYISDFFLSSLNSSSITFKEDLILLNITKFYGNTFISLNNGYDKLVYDKTKKDFFQSLAKLNKFPASSCDKMIKKSFLMENNLFFEKGRLSEDIDWSLKVLYCAKTVAYINKDYYFYRQNREESISYRSNYKNFYDIFHTIEEWICNKHEFQKEINSLLAYEYIMVLWGLNKLDGEEYNIIYSKLIKYKWILRYSKIKKVKVIKHFIYIFGVKNSSRMISFYMSKMKKGN